MRIGASWIRHLDLTVPAQPEPCGMWDFPHSGKLSSEQRRPEKISGLRGTTTYPTGGLLTA